MSRQPKGINKSYTQRNTISIIPNSNISMQTLNLGIN